MRVPLVLAGQEVSISTSIGVAVYAGDKDPGAWMKRADGALYEAKKSGRNAYRLAA